MSSFIKYVTFDCADPGPLSAFWSEVTGYQQVTVREDFAALAEVARAGARVEGGEELVVGEDAGSVPARWRAMKATGRVGRSCSTPRATNSASADGGHTTSGWWARSRP